jgi:hypothetical protein
VIPPVNRKLDLVDDHKPLQPAIRAKKTEGAYPRQAGLYVFRSKLSDLVYKIGVTTSLERRLVEHGGKQKHEVVAWKKMSIQQAYCLEKQLLTLFHDCRVTDGNEIFVLNQDRFNELIQQLTAL